MLDYEIEEAWRALSQLPPIPELTTAHLADLQEAIVRLQDAEHALRRASRTARTVRPE